MQETNQIEFFNEHPDLQLEQTSKVQDFLHHYISGLKLWEAFDIRYVLLTDDDLLTINQEYLNHDFYTDIITFDLSPNELILDSDIYISLDRVKENATFFNTTYENELLRVIFHGILHLQGLNDETEEESQTMREKETSLIELFKNH